VHLYSNAIASNICQYGVDAQFVNDAHAFSGQAQFDEAFLRLDPKSVSVNIGREPALGLVVRVRNVISRHWFLTGDHTNPGHFAASLSLK